MTDTTKLTKTGAAFTGLLALATLFAACSGSSSGGTGGATSTPSGGTAGGAGATGTTSASAGAAEAGKTRASDSTSSAGGSISASTSTCGPKCTTPTTCEPSVIASGITALTDFSSNLDSDHFFHSGGVGDWISLFGGTWVAPVAADPCATTPAVNPLAQSFTEGNWHITGTIAPGKWAGAGIWFATSAACPVFDFSAYSGFSFTIAGNAGPTGSIKVTVGTASNSAPNTDTTSANFTCYSNAATCSGATCTAASVTVADITTTPQTVKVMFADLKGGAPVSTPDPKEITGIGINPNIDWSGTGTEYSLDLIIDDLVLIP
jgi:hypothetical protein